MFPFGFGVWQRHHDSPSHKRSFGGLRVGVTTGRLECERAPSESELNAPGNYLGSRGSALVTMMEPANLQSGNDRSRFGWLHWPRIRCVLLEGSVASAAERAVPPISA
jgi:hypothetical protein